MPGNWGGGARDGSLPARHRRTSGRAPTTTPRCWLALGRALLGPETGSAPRLMALTGGLAAHCQCRDRPQTDDDRVGNMAYHAARQELVRCPTLYLTGNVHYGLRGKHMRLVDWPRARHPKGSLST